MTVPFRWKLRIDLRSPFLIPGPSITTTLTDASFARDAAGTPIIPGTLIRGLFRDALESVGFQEALTVFGGKSGSATAGPEAASDMAQSRRVDNIPKRRTLDFPDLVAERETGIGPVAPFTRVALDSDGTGAARDGHLQFIELAAPLGSVVHFTGTIAGKAEDPDALLPAFQKAGRLIRAIGSNKSSGFGEVVGITLSPVSAAVASPASVPAPDGGSGVRHIDIAFALDRPFLVNAAHTTANEFAGSEVIPGAVLKGALAGSIARLGISPDQLFRTRIGHAFPAWDGQMPAVVPPLSLALCKAGKRSLLLDRLLAGDLDGLPLDHWGPPIFATDWKAADHGDVLKHLKASRPALRRDARTRTAIDGKTGTVAYDRDTESGALFSYSAVRPDGHRWVSRWLIPEDVDPATVAGLTAFLAQGLPGIGKTRAIATAASFTPVGETSAVPLSGGRWALTLQTDAVLGDGDFADYRDYWHGLGFTLVRHFAEQRLVGGYLALRYPVRPDGYAPYVLTRAGSVFLLEGGDAERMAGLLRHGLPPVPPFDRRDWREFPFGRENGFGAVRLNAVDHAALLAGEELDKGGAHA
ncbi:RAMP superfamily CRISPR-associated protein [Azospirillum agricola]|uniref:RAMP superfamily CRISPR-associated protein n=1 Tax=Azospirillum agricola TaxID=1720247 RepID=UPI000A0F3B99|nr:RAMP superfamily CRISPR-associated protein [Azospirillum agricola]SMH30350.1 hypothetical protein SAMN02982994_0289 [Azospirillum lipoferum]